MINAMAAWEPWFICMAHRLLSYRMTPRHSSSLTAPSKTKQVDFIATRSAQLVSLAFFTLDEPAAVHCRTAKPLVVVDQIGLPARARLETSCRHNTVQCKLVQKSHKQHLVDELGEITIVAHFGAK